MMDDLEPGPLQTVARVQWFYDLMIDYQHTMITENETEARKNLLDELMESYYDCFSYLLYHNN